MSTPAISNVFNAVMPGLQAGKANGAPADGTFNQMLTSKIDNQNRPTATTTNWTTSENAQGTCKDGADADASKPADGTRTEEDDKQAEAAEPSDMIAFVTALTQAGTNGNAAPVSASDEIMDRLAGVGVGVGKFIDGKTAPMNFGTAAIADRNGSAANKQADFVASLDKAIHGKDGDAGKTTAATAAAKSADADMADAAQVAVTKTAEQATAPQNVAAVAVATTAAQQQHVNELQDPLANRLRPQVGTDDWGQALGQKVVWMVQGAQQSASLTLNPSDLGPMQIMLHVNNNRATASFIAHQPEVRHALEAAMPRLREMLSESGIQLGQSNVSAGLPNQQNNAADDQRQNSRTSASQNSNAVETAAVNVSHVPVTAAGNGLINTFA